MLTTISRNKAMNMNIIRNTTLATIALICLGSCSNDSISEYERTQSDFANKLGGNISPSQWWRTAVTLKVNLTTDAPTKMWLMSGEDQGTLFDYKEAEASGTIEFTAPQGKGNTMYLVCVRDRQKTTHQITLTGKTEETIDVNTSASRSENAATLSLGTNAKSLTRESTDARLTSSLYGYSIAGNAVHRELSTPQVSEALSLLDRAFKENIPAKSVGANCDYELKSNGDFNITWFAGNCMSSSSHVLGYYYHSPGTYADIKYVDLSETEVYDYIDGLAKVQYKVNEATARQYGLEANRWYDANFDMGDLFENPRPNIAGRLNDDAYNSIAVINRYGNNITNLRGVSFTIKVPEGMYVGFYDRVEGTPQPDQYDRFVRMGIKPYTTRDKFKAMNFSCEAMNMNMNGSYRSCIYKTDNALWLGMENDYTGGDLDCNDVMFEISADLEIHHPTIVEPDLKPFGEYDSVMPWTIAYEDMARNADFDFNDAVIKIEPNLEKEECDVTVMAAGSTSRMYLHYEGPEGDTNLGEIHELLGGRSNTAINTTTSVAQTPFAKVGKVKWFKEYTVQNDARRFYIEVRRGTCSNCGDVITLAEEPGRTPEALLVAGLWKWPMEGVHITKAYDTFANWGKDVTHTTYWNWYANPKANTTVSY